MTPEELQARADAILWFHSIDLGQGVRTTGLSEVSLGPEVLPDFAGKSVLDIGAWDGCYSFLAERQGAARVVALDHYAWGVDIAARDQYWQECAERGVLPDHTKDETEFWRAELPGRRGFELAHEALHSAVEPVVADFATMDLSTLGTFDVVLYLGVLYHMKEPLTCLERVRAVTDEVAVVETEAVHLNGYDRQPLLLFHPGSDVQHDFGNWYVPTVEAVRSLCRAAGFARAEIVNGPPPPPSGRPHARQRLANLLSRPLAPPSAPSANYRAVVHAFA
jgi:tRNA (mo5U34)-methyltransferase